MENFEQIVRAARAQLTEAATSAAKAVGDVKDPRRVAEILREHIEQALNL